MGDYLPKLRQGGSEFGKGIIPAHHQRRPQAQPVQDPTATIPAVDDLTDDQVAALDAVTKAHVLRNAVARAVAHVYDLAHTPVNEIEGVLLMDFRHWQRSPRSGSGIFHWRVPSLRDLTGHD